MTLDNNLFEKGARPVFDSKVYDFVRSVSSECWNESTTIMSFTNKEQFKDLYKKHINMYNYSKLDGIDAFSNTYVTDGVTGAFMDWYAFYGIKNIYVLKGEYPFHYRNGCHLIDRVEDMPSSKVLILSLPFSATGNVHNEYKNIIQHCEQNNITVLLDCAYLNVSALGTIDVSSKCIKSISTSLSKVFATGMNKIGLMFNRDTVESPVKQLDEWHYLNHHSMILHTMLLNKFGMSYIYDKYVSRQDKIIKSYSLQKSNTLLFGISNDTKWSKYSRDGIINRVCISKILQY